VLDNEPLQTALNKNLAAENKEVIDFSLKPSVDDLTAKGITFDKIIDLVNSLQVETLEPIQNGPPDS